MVRFMKIIGWMIAAAAWIVAAATLSFGADPQEDLRLLHERGLPFASAWMQMNTAEGFHTDWHCQQARTRRFLASVKMRGVEDPLVREPWLAALRAHGDARLPISLIGDNWAFPIIARYRAQKVQTISGDSGFCDPLATDPTPWRDWAAQRYRSPVAQTLFGLLPAPAWIEDADNNETGVWNWFLKEALVSVTETNKSKWKGGVPPYRWIGPDATRRISLRLDALIEAHGGYSGDPYALWPRFAELYHEKYAAYAEGVRGACPAGWQNRYTAGYSTASESGYPQPDWVYAAIGPGLHQVSSYDASGVSRYFDRETLDLLSENWMNLPTRQHDAWEWVRGRNPRAYREVWVGGNLFGMLAGARAGKYSVISPSRFGAWCEFLLWQSRAQSGGVPVNLRYWDNWNTPRGKRMFGDPHEVAAANETAAQTRDRLTRIGWANLAWSDLERFGESDLKTATIEDYVLAAIDAADRIGADETLRAFWQRGTTLPVIHKAGTVAPYVVVQLGEKYLVYVWTPKQLGTVTLRTPVGDVPVSFDGAPSIYRIGQPQGLSWSDL